MEGGARLQRGTLGPLAIAREDSKDNDDGAPGTARRPISLSGWLRRSDFEYPALLQDPRRFYAVEASAASAGPE